MPQPWSTTKSTGGPRSFHSRRGGGRGARSVALGASAPGRRDTSRKALALTVALLLSGATGALNPAHGAQQDDPQPESTTATTHQEPAVPESSEPAEQDPTDEQSAESASTESSEPAEQEATDEESPEPAPTGSEPPSDEGVDPERPDPGTKEPSAPGSTEREESEPVTDAQTKSEPAEPEGADPVTVLSTNPPNTLIRVSQVFYAYVAAGENLDISFIKEINSALGVDAAITVRGPDGSVRTCTIPTADPEASSCVWSDLTAGTPGVWAIEFGTGGTSVALDRYSWDIAVQTGAADVPGRVWSEDYRMVQQGGTAGAAVDFWYLNEQGFVYAGSYGDYHGIDSIFTANATGNALVGGCVSAYESFDTIGPYADPQFYVSTDECGPAYRIFFEQPDSSMPATAATWSGGITWLNPPLTLPTLTDLDFVQDPAADIRRGEFSVGVSDFVGSASLQIDANDDGDYADPQDRAIPFAVDDDGTYTIEFDGLDGQGNTISLLDTIGARVLIDRIGEIHFVNQDVERRAGGIVVEALNGPAAGSTTLYWNDTNLRTEDRACLTPELDGRAGVDSSGGVHDWTCDPVAANANDGVNGAWGDARAIDDWTYHQVELDVETTIAGTADFGDAPDTYGTTAADDGPYHSFLDGLTLGTEYDAESDGTPGADADGDAADEDGVSGPLQFAVGADTTITVSATNTTDLAATLAAWVDLDGSGTFDPGELVTVTVPASSGTAEYQLTFPGATATGESYARFRLFGGTPDDILPTGGWASGEVEDYLVSLYGQDIVKEPAGPPTANADGTHTVQFSISVARDGSGPGYDLSDTFTVGDGIAINTASASNTVPGGIVSLDDWDADAGVLSIVEDQAIASGATHEYLVTLNVTIDGEEMTFEDSDCSLDAGETGTGFLNTAEISAGGASAQDDACVEATVLLIDKTVSSGPEPMGDGEYEVVYQVETTNPYAGTAVYDLDDIMRYGEAVTIVGQPQAQAVTSGLTELESVWSAGTSTLRVQTDEPIAAAAGPGEPTVHTYSVTVRFTVALDEVTFDNSDCSLTGSESGTGLLNEARLTVDEQETTDDACPQLPGAPVHEKSVESGPTPLGDGTYELTYRVRVSNASASSGEYDLVDQLRYGDAMTVVEPPQVVSAPDGITPQNTWDGATTSLSIVEAQDIDAGTAAGPATHDYIVQVVVSVDAEDVTFDDSDCTLGGGEAGTGLTNEAILTVNGQDHTDDTCATLSEPVHTKEVTAGPSQVGEGLFEIEYTITVENHGAAPSEYLLDDELRFGSAVRVVDTAVAARPGSIATDASWDGRDDTRLVTDQLIGAATAQGPASHRYVVTVQFRVNADDQTPAGADCQLAGGESGTGLLNVSAMTVNGEESVDDACGTLDDPSAAAPVSPDTPDLPRTGALLSPWLIGLALSLLTLGAGALMAARRLRVHGVTGGAI